MKLFSTFMIFKSLLPSTVLFTEKFKWRFSNLLYSLTRNHLHRKQGSGVQRGKMDGMRTADLSRSSGALIATAWSGLSKQAA